MPNYWEKIYGLNTEINDSYHDLDNDGMLNLLEYQLGLIPNINDAFDDKDNDGIYLILKECRDIKRKILKSFWDIVTIIQKGKFGENVTSVIISYV
jgi:hypothetical protein